MMKLYGLFNFAIFGYALNPEYDIHIPFTFARQQQSIAYSIPIQYGLADSNYTISRVAGLSFVPSNQIVVSRVIGPQIRIDRLIFGRPDQQLVVPVNLEVSETDRNPLVSLHPASLFLHTVGHIMVVPSNSNGGDLIINPSNPFEHVYGGDLVYTRILEGDQRWEFQAQFHMQGIDESEPLHVVLNPAFPGSTVPLEFYNIINNQVRLISTGSGFDLILGDDDFNALPILYISIGSLNGQRFTLAIEPRDYLIALDMKNHYRLTVRPTPEGQPNVLGRNFVDKIALHFDARNRMLGFGEPIAEL